MSEEMDRLRAKTLEKLVSEKAKYLELKYGPPDIEDIALLKEMIELGWNARDRLDLERPEVVALRESVEVLIDMLGNEFNDDGADFKKVLAAYDAVVKRGSIG